MINNDLEFWLDVRQIWINVQHSYAKTGNLDGYEAASKRIIHANARISEIQNASTIRSES